MSARVIALIESEAPRVEIYSIEEIIADLTGVQDITRTCRRIQKRILNEVVLLVCVRASTLFTYRSGSKNEQIDHFVDYELVSEVLVGTRKEKYPGKRWKMLRGYLNRPIPDDLILMHR